MSRPGGNKQARRLMTGLAFLAPNIAGVLVFVVFPVLFAVMLAFTNWDLRLHNMWKNEPLQFVGFENFMRLFREGDFLKFLGNTLFLMMAIPFGIGASLMAAILLSKDTRGGGGRVFAWLCAGAGLVISVSLLAAVGAGATGMTLLMIGLGSGVLMLGIGGGVTAYRTMFYTPHFTAGVATYILWKKLYSPQGGPINAGLDPVLSGLTSAVTAVPAPTVQAGFWLGLLLVLALLAWSASKLRQMWVDGELGTSALVPPVILLLLPIVTACRWSHTESRAHWLLIGLGLVIAWQAFRVVKSGRAFRSSPAMGLGSALMLSLFVMTLQFVLLGLSVVAWNLPMMAAAEEGLQPPRWLADYHWAKPAIMLMGFWGAVGSNNMLLYLAALTNVPEELYEAANIDGAGRFQKFWHVTWPQLAPTTFFIAVMSTIGGLQGGFEMARVMTQGGPAGSTTTLAYFIYTEGFETGRLSFASATAWALFILVFTVTMFNWKFGNKYVNE
jgi:multiple sugar transport system permease protein